MAKPYSEMTEQERKEWFGYAFKRTNPQDVPEAYICTCDSNQIGSGYGVVAKEYDPDGKYDLDELKRYLADYPEMNCIGWKKPNTQWQDDLVEIRTKWTSLSESELSKKLYETAYYKFINDDIWQGPAYIDIKNGVTETQWLGTWGSNDEHLTCDRASQLYTQYAGDDDTKAAQVLALRNEMKAYCKAASTKFYAEHYNKPEPPTFEPEYMND